MWQSASAVMWRNTYSHKGYSITKRTKMSDGNFNRALLPHGGYASGVRAGQAAERKRMVLVLERLLKEMFPELSEEERSQFIKRFKQKAAE